MNTNSRENASKTDDRIDKLADQISTLVDIFAKKVVTPAPVKVVEESCVTCGGPHAYYNFPNINSNQLSVCAMSVTYKQVTPQNHASNYMAPPGFALVKNGQNRFNQNQGQGNYFNRRNNFHVMLLKKLLEKLGDPGRFLKPCDFLGNDRGVCSGNAWFSNNISGGNPTSTFEPILSDSSPSLTPFERSDFILEEIKAYLKDESISPEIDHADCDSKEDICLIEKLLNDDPF
nr:reverse transcriptase domain-containing protein [Tanacetum cinerariifolium]